MAASFRDDYQLPVDQLDQVNEAGHFSGFCFMHKELIGPIAKTAAMACFRRIKKDRVLNVPARWTVKMTPRTKNGKPRAVLQEHLNSEIESV